MEKVKVFHFDFKLEESSQVARAALQLKLINSVVCDWIYLLHALSYFDLRHSVMSSTYQRIQK